MGLDLMIYLRAKEKNGFSYNIEIAYWRKFWSLRDELLKLFTSKKEDIISQYEDITTEVPISYLYDTILLLSDKIPHKEDICFDNSVWDTAEARLITIDNLKELCAWESALDILANGDADYRSEENFRYTFEELINLDQGISSEGDGYDDFRKDKKVVDLLMNFDNYTWTLELENSY